MTEDSADDHNISESTMEKCRIERWNAHGSHAMEMLLAVMLTVLQTKTRTFGGHLLSMFLGVLDYDSCTIKCDWGGMRSKINDDGKYVM